MWERIYQAPTKTNWVGRQDVPARTHVFQVIETHDLRDKSLSMQTKPAFALLGFACDAGVKRNQGRVGAKEGPAAIRAALAVMPCKREPVTWLDVGDIVCHEDELEAAQQALGELIAILLQHQITPIVLGGGHELAFGHYQGIVKAQKDHELAIVNFDAHLDMRPLLPNAQGSSGTPFLQIAHDRDARQKPFHYTCIGLQSVGNSKLLEETAKKQHVQAVYAQALHEQGLVSARDVLHDVIDHAQSLYVSLCLDVFASPFAPGVSAPQILGLFPWQVISLLRELLQSKKVVSIDIAEYCPAFDIDARTAKLAASLIYEIIHYHTI